MNTLLFGLVGAGFSAGFTAIVCIMCYMGFGEPNYMVAEGQTYIGWVLKVFGSTALSFVLLGLIFDTLGTLQYFLRKRA